jgi:hypothetical protein
LLDVDFETFPLMRLLRASNLLVKRRAAVESALHFTRIQDLFGLPVTVTLYDITNTYFEAPATENPKAARGRSKEKRADCPLVTLGLVLDGSGFVRRSKMFAGNVVEANIAWLKDHGYRYLVVSHARTRQFDPEHAIETPTATEQTIRLQRVLSEDGAEVRLYCHSEGRETKEIAMAARFGTAFEAGMTRIAEALANPRGQKKLQTFNQLIGRLKQKSRGASQHDGIAVTPDATGTLATALTWTKVPREGSMLTHPGVYCLRSNDTGWEAEGLWHTYTMLTDPEAVFRSLKSERGLRPVFHHKEHRTEGHLFITVLAYQRVQAIRFKLNAAGEHAIWASLRAVLLYNALEIDLKPGGVRKHTV